MSEKAKMKEWALMQDVCSFQRTLWEREMTFLRWTKMSAPPLYHCVVLFVNYTYKRCQKRQSWKNECLCKMSVVFEGPFESVKWLSWGELRCQLPPCIIVLFCLWITYTYKRNIFLSAERSEREQNRDLYISSLKVILSCKFACLNKVIGIKATIVIISFHPKSLVITTR